MIICSSCQTKFVNSTEPAQFYRCSSCAYSPQKTDDFFSWAPELASENENFPAESFKKLVEVEAGSFWFRSRNTIILWALKKYCGDFESLLEIGCGTGFVLSAIKKQYPSVRIQGSEIHSNGLTLAAVRLPDVELVQLDARRLPYADEFDVIAAFDVIEHISEDKQVLRNIHVGLKQHGFCVVTVPQHMWLWSQVDTDACHQRRYSATELHIKMKRAGFEIIRTTSFVSLLIPLMLLARRPANTAKSNKTSTVGLGLPPWLDKLLGWVMAVEFLLIKLGFSPPIGGSRLVVAKKIDI